MRMKIPAATAAKTTNRPADVLMTPAAPSKKTIPAAVAAVAVMKRTDDHYCVLVTMDENDPELVITKVVSLEDGSEGLMSLDDEEYDRVYAEYERLCEEEDEGDEDADEETEEEE